MTEQTAGGQRGAGQRGAQQSELGVAAAPPGDERGDQRHEEVGGQQRRRRRSPSSIAVFRYWLSRMYMGFVGQVRPAAVAEPRRLMHEPLDLRIVVQRGPAPSRRCVPAPKNAVSVPITPGADMNTAASAERRGAQRDQPLPRRHQDHEHREAPARPR